MYQWCEFKFRRGKNKNLSTQRSNSNTVGFNFQTFIYVFIFIMLSVNIFCNISSCDILAYITKNYIALIYYAKIVHLLCQFNAGVGFSAVCQAIYS